MYRLALESGKAGSAYHAAAEGVPVKQIATTVRNKLELPLSSANGLRALIKLSLFSMTVSLHTRANSNWTQKELCWKAVQPDLISELNQDFYYSNQLS